LSGFGGGGGGDGVEDVLELLLFIIGDDGGVGSFGFLLPLAVFVVPTSLPVTFLSSLTWNTNI
jgi:hypothetical protein